MQDLLTDENREMTTHLPKTQGSSGGGEGGAQPGVRDPSRKLALLLLCGVSAALALTGVGERISRRQGVVPALLQVEGAPFK